MISLPFAQSGRIETASPAPGTRRDNAAPDGRDRTAATRRRMQFRRPAAQGTRTRRRHDRCPRRAS
ncbi:hypothetical protein BDI4_820009 [Burkholderia diffusa]|nr:hypothetical protein BDI4_820009 [Burkholderia diffusa]